jgi:hypothetical protein
MGVLVLTDGDGELASHLAEDLAAEAWSLRERLAAPEALTLAYQHIRRPLYPIDRR